MTGIRPGPGPGPRPYCLLLQYHFFPPQTLEILRKMKVLGIGGAPSLPRILAGTGTETGTGNVSVAQPEPETILWPNRNRGWNRTATGTETGTATGTGSGQGAGPGPGSGLQQGLGCRGPEKWSRVRKTIYRNSQDHLPEKCPENDHLFPENARKMTIYSGNARK